jgi:hypothetical protein
MNESNQNDLELIEMRNTLLNLAGDLNVTPIEKRSPREAEISNLRMIIECTLDYLNETSEEELTEIIKRLQTRIQGLVDNPDSAGKHDSMI